MEATFKLEGAKEFANLLKNLPMEMERSAVYSGLRGAALPVKKAVQRKAPIYQGKGHASRTTSTWANTGSNVSVLPGTLKRSITIRKNPKQKLGVLVGPGRAFYAMFLEWGAKAHKIEPMGLRPVRFPKRVSSEQRAALRGKAPRMLADYTTGRFFGKKVNHPGVKKRPFLGPALQESKQEMVTAFGRSLASAINRNADKWLGKYRVKRR